MDISIAVDFSTTEIVLALGKPGSDEIICSASKEMSGREASSLLPWIISKIEENGYQLNEIKQWTCGTGPGSFTGLRIIASLIAGLTYDRDKMEVRGIPSGTAIIEAISHNNEKSIILFDGRNRELIGFSSKNNPLLIISSDNVNQLESFVNFGALESQRPALVNILPESLLKKVCFLDEFPINNLLLNKEFPFQKIKKGESSFDPDLVYIRPPV